MKTSIVNRLAIVIAFATFAFLYEINDVLSLNLDINALHFILMLIISLFSVPTILARIENRIRDASTQRIYKEIAGISQQHTIHHTSFEWSWIMVVRNILLWLYVMPTIRTLVVISVFLIMSISKFKPNDFGLLWFYLLFWSGTVLFLFRWLRLAVLLFFQLYNSYKKGAFLHANQHALEYCLFPAVAWQYVQSISPEIHETSIDDTEAGFSQYGIRFTLDAAWQQQHAMPRWYALLFGFANHMRQLKERNVLYLPCDVLGRQVLVAASELIMLRIQYAQRTGAWSPELLEKLAKANIPPEEWLTEKTTAVQIKLAAISQLEHITNVEQNTIHNLLQQFNDFFTTDGGSWSDELDKRAEKARKKERAPQNLHQELHVIEQVLAEIHACTNPSPEQAIRQKVLTRRAAQIEHRIAASSATSS